MKVIEVLDSNKQVLARCAPEEPILTVSEQLSALNIGAMPVCGAGGGADRHHLRARHRPRLRPNGRQTHRTSRPGT